MTTRIQITSLMSETADRWFSAMADALGRRLGLAVGYDRTLSETARLAGLLDGSIQAGWVCGIVYVNQPDLELLAAPVMRGERYAGRPVYFSDVFVRRDSAYEKLSDLQNARFAYNQRGSFSGDLSMRAGLQTIGESPEFFGQWIESGAHTHSIQMVIGREVDAAAIDSTVIDFLAATDPGLLKSLRTVSTFGPYPIPPWVTSNRVPPGLQTTLRSALLEMHQTNYGQKALNGGQVERFAAVEDPAYDPIRRVAEAVAAAPASQSPNTDS